MISDMEAELLKAEKQALERQVNYAVIKAQLLQDIRPNSHHYFEYWRLQAAIAAYLFFLFIWTLISDGWDSGLIANGLLAIFFGAVSYRAYKKKKHDESHPMEI